MKSGVKYYWFFVVLLTILNIFIFSLASEQLEKYLVANIVLQE